MAQPAEALKQILRTWLKERHQGLLEQVMMTWEEGLGRLNPDDALASELLAAVPVPEPLLAPAPAVTPMANTDRELGSALDLLDAAQSQAEVLHKLLDGLRPFADRSALFILKQGIANLYASRGFDGDSAKPGTPVVPPLELEALISGQVSSIQQAGEAYLSLVRPLSGLTSADLRIHTIRLKRKAVALVLADSGLRRAMENPNHIRALVRGAEAALAYLAGQKDDERTGTGPMKSSGPMPMPMPAPMPQVQPPPSPPIPQTSAPHSMATGPVPVPQGLRSPAPAPMVPMAPMAPVSLPSYSAPTQQVPEPIESATTLDPKIRTTAERLARVLVGDIELYFPQKVAQGRQQGNLYGLLRDELERSRATFIDRFGEPVEKEHRIFIQTVLSQLCEGIPTKLGSAPWA